MNSNRRIVLFVIGSCLLYLFISIADSVFNFNYPPLRRINLIADIIKKDSNSPVADSTSVKENEPPVVIHTDAARDISLYTTAHLITNFSTDSTGSSLQRLMKKLNELKKGKKTKVRIGYFGDSMIEADLLTQTLRKLLQKEFGGSGVGFVPVTNPSAKIRQTVSSSASSNWDELNFKSSGRRNKLFLSGYLFTGNGAWLEMRDNTIKDSAAIIEKRLFYGHSEEPATVVINNSQSLTVPDMPEFGNLLLEKSGRRNIRVNTTSAALPVYGISFETESGVIVDNFSFRGISGVEYNLIDSGFLKAIAENNTYDLLVFQYGVNVLFKPNDKNFNWYARMLMPSLKKLKNSFPNADFIIVSTADRAFRYDDQYQSAVGIDSLIKVQAVAAYETGAAFYNQFETMGGKNSIVAWANANPSLANKDYVHPNHRGAEILAGYFFDALMKDYQRYIQHEK